jgi:hypothetical protein
MDVVVGIVAIAVLLVLIVVSLRLQRATRATERQQADVRAHVGDAQREASVRHRAEVRAATDERVGPAASHADE